MEQQGFIADRCELNRQIKADNKLLRELRSTFEKIAKAVKNTVPAIAEAMETLRRNMLIFRYQILHTKANRRSIKNTLADVMPVLRQYSDLVGQIKTLSRERKGLLDEKKATSVLNILKQRELAKRIAQLSEDIEELRSEKAMILSRFDKTDDDGMKEVKQWVASMESTLQRLEQTEAKYQTELDAALAQFRELAGEAESMDKAELQDQRQSLRKPYTKTAREKIQQAHGKQYSPITMMEAQPSRMWIICSGRTRESWNRRCKGGPSDTSRNPRKSRSSGTMKDKVKNRENQEKSDRRVSNERRIVWNLPIGKQALFPGSRAEENLRKTGGFL